VTFPEAFASSAFHVISFDDTRCPRGGIVGPNNGCVQPLRAPVAGPLVVAMSAAGNRRRMHEAVIFPRHFFPCVTPVLPAVVSVDSCAQQLARQSRTAGRDVIKITIPILFSAAIVTFADCP